MTITEQINKIKWVKINPDDESTFPIEKNVELEENECILYCHQDDSYVKYFIDCCAVTLITYYYNEITENEPLPRKKLYAEYNNKRLEIIKWAVVDLGEVDDE